MSYRTDHSSRKNPKGMIVVISIVAVAIIVIPIILLFVWPGWLSKTDKEPVQGEHINTESENPVSEREPLTPDFSYDEVTNSYSYENDNGGLIRVHIPTENDIVIDKSTAISYVKNELILRVKPEISDDQVALCIANLGGRIVGQNTYLHTYQVQFTTEYPSLVSIDQQTEKCMATGIFDSAYPNYAISSEPEETGEFSISDTEWSPWNETTDKHWGADAIHAPAMWQLLDDIDTQTVKVGVLDNVFFTDHVDLDFAAFSREWIPTESFHGTHVAGIIAAKHDNGEGISGVATDVELYGYSVAGFRSFDSKENIMGGTVAEFQAGLTYLICIHECKVVNVSWGWGSDEKSYADYGYSQEQFESGEYLQLFDIKLTREEAPVIEALDIFLYEYGLDFVIVTAAGNSNENPLWFHDAYYNNELIHLKRKDLRSRIIVVGNAYQTGETFRVSADSCCGSCVDLIAPGTNIWSTIPYRDSFLSKTDKYGNKSGTSMASPQVSGVAAAMWSVNPNLTGPQIKQIILDTCSETSYPYEPGDAFRTDTYRMVDAQRAVETAIGINASEPEVPVPDYDTTTKVKDSNVYPGTWRETYLEILLDNASQIRWIEDMQASYRDYIEGDPLYVAFFDMDGDDIPEMFFIKSNGEDEYIGDLYIYRNNGTETRCVLSLDDVFTSASNGEYYSLLYSPSNKTLTILYYIGNGVWGREFRIRDFEEALNLLFVAIDDDLICYEEYYMNGKPISHSLYESAVAPWKEMEEGGFVLASTDFASSDPSILYTVDEAIRYLRGDTASEITEPEDYSLITFGEFEQNGDESDGPEALQWRILYQEGNTALVLCEYVILIRPFGGGLQNWERSDLRAWLNGEFLSSAFNGIETRKIVLRSELNLGNEFWVASDDRETSDLIFLLSQKEIEKLLPNPETRLGSPTRYARYSSGYPDSESYVPWWLRTNGIFFGEAMLVQTDGTINTDGTYGGDQYGVRPAMWVTRYWMY